MPPWRIEKKGIAILLRWCLIRAKKKCECRKNSEGKKNREIVHNYLQMLVPEVPWPLSKKITVFGVVIFLHNGEMWFDTKSTIPPK